MPTSTRDPTVAPIGYYLDGRTEDELLRVVVTPEEDWAFHDGLRCLCAVVGQGEPGVTEQLFYRGRHPYSRVVALEDRFGFDRLLHAIQSRAARLLAERWGVSVGTGVTAAEGV